MDYYDRNLESIKEYRDNMYQSVVSRGDSLATNCLEDIRTSKARNGEDIVTVYYQQKEFRLNSIYNPTQEAKRWVEQFSFTNINNVIVMFGLGNGVFAKAIMSKMNKGDIFIIYEPSIELFTHVISNHDLTDLIVNPNVVLAIKDINEFEFHNILQAKTNVTNIKNIIKCVYPNYDKIFPESCILFWQELKDVFNHAIIQINTSIAFGKVYIENAIKNLKYLPDTASIYELRESLPKNIPAIVVAAGPSVADQIETLKKAKGKALIVAVDRILDFLLDSGVEPDFVFTLDPIKPVEFFTKRSDITIPMLTFIVSNNEIFEIHKGKKIICNCSEFLINFYKEINKTPPYIISSGSVATAAFTACVEMGFDNIILVGQDLAYKGNITHAGGVEEKTSSSDIIMVRGVEGKMVRTRYDWKEFLTWYEDFLTIYPSINVVDTKDSGAKIKGTTLMSLEAAIKEYSHGRFRISDEILSLTFSEDETSKFREYLEGGITQLDEIEVKAIEALIICDNLIRDNKKNILSNKIDKNIRKIKNINKFIEEQQIYKLMDYYVAAVTTQKLAEVYQFTDSLKEDSINTYIRAKAIFEGIVEAINIMRPLLEEAKETILN